MIVVGHEYYSRQQIVLEVYEERPEATVDFCYIPTLSHLYSKGRFSSGYEYFYSCPLAIVLYLFTLLETNYFTSLPSW